MTLLFPVADSVSFFLSSIAFYFALLLTVESSKDGKHFLDVFECAVSISYNGFFFACLFSLFLFLICLRLLSILEASFTFFHFLKVCPDPAVCTFFLSLFLLDLSRKSWRCPLFRFVVPNSPLLVQSFPSFPRNVISSFTCALALCGPCGLRKQDFANDGILPCGVIAEKPLPRRTLAVRRDFIKNIYSRDPYRDFCAGPYVFTLPA